MSAPLLVMWLVVFAIGVPSAWRNPTAAALVIAWLAGQAVFYITGDNLPVQFYAFPDVFVLAMIMAKQEYCNRRPYRSVLHQLSCVLLERSPADRAVMLVFPAVWLIYVAPMHDYHRWWLLWSLTILQFLFASAESLEIFWRQRAMSKSVPPIIDRHLVVIPFKRRDAEAVRTTPVHSGAMLIANGVRGYG